MSNHNHFVAEPNQMLRQRPDMHFNTTHSWIEEITHHCDAVGLLRRHFIQEGLIFYPFTVTYRDTT
jgi:hypothetical protein